METSATSVGEDVGRVLGDAGRRRALRRSGLLDSTNETVFDRRTRMACSLLRCEVALISLVDHDRQFFKSAMGLPAFWHTARQTPLTHSFCQYVVASAAALAVTDAREVAFLHDKQAIRDLGVIAYLGVPPRAPDGHVIGAVCAIEAEPPPWTEDDVDCLFDLAEIARLGGDSSPSWSTRRRPRPRSTNSLHGCAASSPSRCGSKAGGSRWMAASVP